MIESSWSYGEGSDHVLTFFSTETMGEFPTANILKTEKDSYNKITEILTKQSKEGGVKRKGGGREIITKLCSANLKLLFCISH